MPNWYISKEEWATMPQHIKDDWPDIVWEKKKGKPIKAGTDDARMYHPGKTTTLVPWVPKKDGMQKGARKSSERKQRGS